MMSANQSFQNNGVNETRIPCGDESLSPGRCPVEMQHGPGRHHATAVRSTRRRKWSQEENRVVMECYYRSEPRVKGYRKRMHDLWIAKDLFIATEQRIVDQANQIRKRKWLSDLELEEIRRNIDDVQHGELGPEVVNENLTVSENEGEQIENERPMQGEENVQHDKLYILPDYELSEEEQGLFIRMEEILNSERIRLPSLRGINKGKLKSTVKKVDTLMSKIEADNITTTNDIIYAGAALVTEMVGANKLKSKQKEPWWKRRLETKVREMNRDLGRINTLLEKKPIKKKHYERLKRKYNVKTKGLKVVREEIKQRIKAKVGKITRYQNRISQYQQNRMFNNNEGRFYQQLNNDVNNQTNEILDAQETRMYWESIWSESKEHNREAEWLKNRHTTTDNNQEQPRIAISVEKLRKIVGKMPNWKAPGPDGVQGYWLKNFRSVHENLRAQLTECLQRGEVPLWMNKGRTVLIQKDKNRGTAASNYRPITCLPLTWKLLTGIIADEIYEYLDSKMMLPEEQKGCRRKSRGTHDLLFIDKMILKEVKTRKKNLATAWIDYKKAFDMVLHSWILECLKMFGINEEVRKLIKVSMKNW